MLHKLTPLLFVFIFLYACNDKQQSNIELIENAHNKNKFNEHKAIEFDFYLKFGGKDRLQGKLTFTTNSSSGLLELTNGNKIYYNNDKVYASPELAENESVRFDAYTWAYFFLFPYKLSDEGTVWSKETNVTMNNKKYVSQTLTFKSGTGDAPDDWYIVYSNPQTHLIEVAAYIVTLNKTKEDAEKNPHAISYNNYINVDGIKIANSWSFWEWDKTNGLTKQIGEATLNNIKFISPNEDFFKAPDNYIEK